MKCYICLTDSIVNRKDYFNMLKVTLISARKNTSLRLICLYDGKIGDPVYNLLKDFSDYPFMHLLYSQLLVCQRVCLQNTVCLICK